MVTMTKRKGVFAWSYFLLVLVAATKAMSNSALFWLVSVPSRKHPSRAVPRNPGGHPSLHSQFHLVSFLKTSQHFPELLKVPFKTMMKLLRNYLFLQLLFVCLVMLAVQAQTNEESCDAYEEKDDCNDGRIGSGFTSYKCRWCSPWFGFGQDGCHKYTSWPYCW